MNQDTPIRLAQAAEKRGLTISTLRTEARRGRLTIWRVAGKDWTSLAEIDRMFQKCQVAPRESIYGLDLPAAIDPAASSEKPAGSSKTKDARLALDSALMTAKRLKIGSRSTLLNDINQPDVNVLFLKSK